MSATHSTQSTLSLEQRTWNLSQSPTYKMGQSQAYHLTYAHISSHPDWSILALYHYCEQSYGDYGFTKDVFNNCCKEYINQTA